MKSTVIPVFIFVINSRNETECLWESNWCDESNWCFQKNVKTFPQNKKLYLMPPSRHGHFRLILILPVKMVELSQQHAYTIAHWLWALPLPIAAKSTILNLTEFLDLSLKTSPCTKTSPVWCKNQSFFLFFQNVATLSKVILLFSVALYSMMKYFWSDSCYESSR